MGYWARDYGKFTFIYPISPLRFTPVNLKNMVKMFEFFQQALVLFYIVLEKKAIVKTKNSPFRKVNGNLNLTRCFYKKMTRIYL